MRDTRRRACLLHTHTSTHTLLRFAVCGLWFVDRGHDIDGLTGHLFEPKAPTATPFRTATTSIPGTASHLCFASCPLGGRRGLWQLCRQMEMERTPSPVPPRNLRQQTASQILCLRFVLLSKGPRVAGSVTGLLPEADMSGPARFPLGLDNQAVIFTRAACSIHSFIRS